jgi:hypothetical protein
MFGVHFAKLQYIVLLIAPLALASPFTVKRSQLPSPLHERNETCTGYYNFGISNIDVIEQRSADKDTIYLSASLVVGEDTYTITKYYGKHGKGSFVPDILFQNIPVAGDQIAILAYLAINDGHGSIMGNEYTLGNNTLTLAQNGYDNVQNQPQDDILEILIEVIGMTFARIIRFLFSVVEEAIDLFTQGCDGWLAAGVHGFTGEQICSGSVTLSGDDTCNGAEDEELFGFIPGVVCNTQRSIYEISWFAEISDGLGNKTLPGAYFNKASIQRIISGWIFGTLIVALYIYFS